MSNIFHLKIQSFVTAIIFFVITLFSTLVFAKQDVSWEVGAAVGVFDIPLYPGSSQSKTYVLPLPHAIYRSEFFNVDDGIQATFLKNSKWRLDLSAGLGVPVNSQDSIAREGMPDLDVVFQLGPLLELTLEGSRKKRHHTRFELPLRFAIATDFKSVDPVGWILEPRVTYTKNRLSKRGLYYQFTSGLSFTTKKHQNYYYEVTSKFAKPNRTEYHSNAGYSGFFVNGFVSWRTDNLIWFALMRYQNLTGTKFEDSPLLEQTNYLFTGIGVTWVFLRSH